MKRLKMISMIVLLVGIICMFLFRFFFTVPEWCVRITGIVLLVSIFTVVFSSVRIGRRKNKG